MVPWAHGAAAACSSVWKASSHMCATQQLEPWWASPAGTHLGAVGERLSAGRVALADGCRLCLRGAASYKGNAITTCRFFYDKH